MTLTEDTPLLTNKQDLVVDEPTSSPTLRRHHSDSTVVEIALDAIHEAKDVIVETVETVQETVVHGIEEAKEVLEHGIEEAKEVLEEEVAEPVKPREEGDHSRKLSALSLAIIVFYKVCLLVFFFGVLRF